MGPVVWALDWPEGSVIDWVTCKIPLGEPHPELRAGEHLIVAADGSIDKAWALPLPVPGSHDSNLYVTSTWHPGKPEHRLMPGSSYLYLTGNPVKWWQGHNVWGTDRLRELLAVTADVVCHLLEVDVTPEVRRLWWQGWIPLTRVDCTKMVEFPSRADVRAYLRMLEMGARSRRSGAVTKGSTVYFGLGSRYWMLKYYSKGDELDSKSVKHQLPEGIMYREPILEYADRTLRVELQLRGMELERLGLQMARAWEPETAMEVLEAYVSKIQTQELIELPSDVLEALPGRLVSVYEAWRAGHDLRALYAKNTFYRYRRELLEVGGIDISLPAPADGTENVVQFRRTSEYRTLGVPEWAKGSLVYYEPPSFPLCEQPTLF